MSICATDLVRPACVIFNCCFKCSRVFLSSVSEGVESLLLLLLPGAGDEVEAVFMVGNGRIVLSCCHVVMMGCVGWAGVQCKCKQIRYDSFLLLGTQVTRQGQGKTWSSKNLCRGFNLNSSLPPFIVSRWCFVRVLVSLSAVGVAVVVAVVISVVISVVCSVVRSVLH